MKPKGLFVVIAIDVNHMASVESTWTATNEFPDVNPAKLPRHFQFSARGNSICTPLCHRDGAKKTSRRCEVRHSPWRCRRGTGNLFDERKSQRPFHWQTTLLSHCQTEIVPFADMRSGSSSILGFEKEEGLAGNGGSRGGIAFATWL